MDEFEYLYSDEFFIIDSNNLENVVSKLYGFAIVENTIVFNHKFLNKDKLDGTGSYIFIYKKNDSIEIFQDFNGSYGLFVYLNKENNYFAISNSFLKLVDYLKHTVKLSLNQDYAKSYLTSEFCSIAYKQTLVNEIFVLPHFKYITLDVRNKKIKFNEIDYCEKSISIDSEEYLKILDEWFLKWINIFSNVYKNTQNIKLDISGGFDSRVVLTLMLNSGINLNNIEVVSYENTNNETFDEDFKIASEIAKDFEIELNKSRFSISKYYFNDLKTSINLSYYSKLGFSKQMYWSDGRYEDKLIHIRGYGGEIIRQIYKNPSIESHILSQVNRSKKYSNECGDSTKRILEENFKEFKLLDKNYTVKDYLNLQYRFTRNRYHYGKASVESFLSNIISLNPLIDPLLNKLKTNNEQHDFYNFLPCLIYLRYCPKLLTYKFEGNRKLDLKTLNYAKEISDKIPFFANNIKNRISSCAESNIESNKYIKKFNNVKSPFHPNDQYKFLINIFNSKSFKNLFSYYFSEDLYIKLQYNENKLMPNDPNSDLNSLIAILKIIEDIKFNESICNETIFDWLVNIDESSLICIDDEKTIDFNYADLLNKYNTARIDLKNSGNASNDIKILDISDSNCVQLKPLWFSDSKGIGLQLESKKNMLDVKFKCINAGKLFIYLKSKDVKDFKGNNLPIYIIYRKFRINNEEVLNNEKIAYLNKPISFVKNVKNNEIIDIHLEWEPY